MKYTSLNKTDNVYHKCLYHVVWCTKYRRHVLDDKCVKRLEGIFKDAEEEGCSIIKLDITPNTVYIDIEVSPQFGVHQFVKKLKGESSRILRDKVPHIKTRLPTLCTNSYLFMTQKDEEAINTYLESLPISQRQEEREMGVINEKLKKNSY